MVITLQQVFIAFEDSITSTPLSADAQGLFMRLLHYANKGRVKTQDGWTFPEWFAVPQAQIMEDLKINDKHTLYRIRDELVSAGFLEIKKSQGREPPRYRLTVPETGQPRTSPSAAPSGKNIEHYSSFNTEEFFTAAVKKTFGDDFDMSILGKNSG